MKNRKLKIILMMLLGIVILITLLFFGIELLLPSGVSYIPETAVLVAEVLCFVWIIIVFVVLFLIKSHIKEPLNLVWKVLLKILLFVAGIIICVFLMWHCFLYILSSEEKVRQYDEHIALYVDNSFVRVEHRRLHYSYHENFLLMRNLSDDELKNAIEKYGDPDDYYNLKSDF